MKENKVKVNSFYITPLAWIIEAILLIEVLAIKIIPYGIDYITLGLLGLYIIIRRIEYPTERDIKKIKRDYPDFYKKHKNRIKQM